MFKLSNLQVSASKPLFKESSETFLRMSVANIAIKTENKAKVKSQFHLQWNQSLILPMEYNKQILFEVYEDHKFGFNIDQFENILRGIIVFDRLQTNKGAWEMFTLGREKIGTLTATIAHCKRDAKQTEVFSQQKQSKKQIISKCPNNSELFVPRSKVDMLNLAWNQKKHHRTCDDLLNEEIKRIKSEKENLKSSRLNRAPVLNFHVENMTKKGKRVSTLNLNKITFSKEKRFKQKQEIDKKKKGFNIIGGSLSARTFGSKKENLVGDYALPSIWDRN